MHSQKYKFIFLTLVFLFLISLNGFGQRFYEDVIELKDGSKIRGWIMEQIPGEYIKVELLGGSMLIYQQSEIKRITKEYSQYKKIRRRINRKKDPIRFNDKGFYKSFSLGFMFNEGRWGTRVDPGFQLRAGYRFNQYLAIGGGLGLEGYEPGLIIPFFGEINGDLLQKRITPHYLVQAGYGHGVATNWQTQEFNGGLTGQAGVGFKIHTRKKIEYTYMLVFKYQESFDVQTPWGGWDPWGNPTEPATISTERTYQSLALQISINF